MRAGPVGAEVSPGLPLGEIAHHRVLARILVVDRAAFIGDVTAGAGVVGRRVAEADGVADLVQQGVLAIAKLNRNSIVRQRTVDPDIALDLVEAGRAGHAAGQIGKGGRAFLPGTIVGQQYRGIVGILAPGVLDALEGDSSHVRPGGESQYASGDLGGVELAEAGSVCRHGRDRVPEGVGHRRRRPEPGGPALVAAGDLGPGIGRTQRGLAVGAEHPAVVGIQSEQRTAVAGLCRAVEARTAGADLIAGDGPERGRGAGSALSRRVHHVEVFGEVAALGTGTAGLEAIKHRKYPQEGTGNSTTLTPRVETTSAGNSQVFN